MWIRIDSHSGVPIYRQIAAQIEQAVLSGILESGDRLPGVRELAVDLTVNPATVARAYEELQRVGVIEQPRGRGTFVRGRPTLPESERRARMRAAADAMLHEAERLGFSADEARAEVERAARESEGSGDPDREGERHGSR